jgi:hypothetical protein
MSTGQLVEDVRLALDGKVDVQFFGRVGGNVPLAEEVCRELMCRVGVEEAADWAV